MLLSQFFFERHQVSESLFLSLRSELRDYARSKYCMDSSLLKDLEDYLKKVIDALYDKFGWENAYMQAYVFYDNVMFSWLDKMLKNIKEEQTFSSNLIDIELNDLYSIRI